MPPAHPSTTRVDPGRRRPIDVQTPSRGDRRLPRRRACSLPSPRAPFDAARRARAAPDGPPRRAGPVLACALAIPVALAASPAAVVAQPWDVVIRGGRVLDGSGNPWFRADVALRGDRIVAVGDLGDAPAAEVVDATGLYVAPGFVDAHSHAAPALETDGLSGAGPLLAQGVTTVFVNPDGGGPVDLAAQRDSLLRHGLGVNVAPLVPHGSIRRAVLGMDDRPPTGAELERMKALVRAGMEEGAFGLSSGPFYPPGSYSDTGELVELARVAGEYGGAYTSHVRDESDYTVGVVAAVDEVITVAREAGVPGVVTHVKVLGPPVWGYATALVRRVERARAEGVEVYADQYPYLASATGLGAALLPRWAQAGGDDSLSARLERPGDRARIRRAMEENLARRGGPDRIRFRRFREDPSVEGRTLADVASERGLDPLDAALSMLEAGEPGIVSFNMHEADVRVLMVQPWTMTGSDGGLTPPGEGVPHPRNYGAFPRKLRHYVLEEGVLDLGAAIRSMTGLPARAFRLPDRGVLRPGAYADVVVFDLDAVRDVGTFADPHHLAEGMVHVWVSGGRVVRDGRLTGARPGRVLRRDGAAPGRR